MKFSRIYIRGENTEYSRIQLDRKYEKNTGRSKTNLTKTYLSAILAIHIAQGPTSPFSSKISIRGVRKKTGRGETNLTKTYLSQRCPGTHDAHCTGNHLSVCIKISIRGVRKKSETNLTKTYLSQRRTRTHPSLCSLTPGNGRDVKFASPPIEQQPQQPQYNFPQTIIPKCKVCLKYQGFCSFLISILLKGNIFVFPTYGRTPICKKNH